MNNNIKTLVNTLFENDLFDDDIDDALNDIQQDSLIKGVSGFKQEIYDAVTTGSLPHIKNNIKIDALNTFPDAYYKFTDLKESMRNRKFKAFIARMISGFTKQCSKEKPINLNWIDTSNITDFSDIFRGLTNIYVDVSRWDTSAVKNMSKTFSYNNCTSEGISNWDMSNVEDMSEMFKSNHTKDILIDISKWNTKSLKNIKEMFSESSSIFIDMNKLNTSQVENMSNCFSDCSHIDLNLIDNMDTHNVKIMWSTFRYSTIIGSGKLNWNVENVEDMSNMFAHANIKDIDISDWNTKSVKTMSNMFDRSNFNGNIDNWNVENVISMENIFVNSSFTGKLTNWNIKHASAYDKNEYCVNHILPKLKDNTEPMTLQDILDFMTYNKSVLQNDGKRKVTTLIHDIFKDLKFQIVKNNNEEDEE